MCTVKFQENDSRVGQLLALAQQTTTCQKLCEIFAFYNIELMACLATKSLESAILLVYFIIRTIEKLCMKSYKNTVLHGCHNSRSKLILAVDSLREDVKQITVDKLCPKLLLSTI